MVKNKALPDVARLCNPSLVTLSLSLSPSQTWPYQGYSHMSFSLANAVHPEGTPWILLRLDPTHHGKKKESEMQYLDAVSKTTE